MEQKTGDISVDEVDQDEWTLVNFFINSVDPPEFQKTDLSLKTNGLFGIVPLADDSRSANSSPCSPVTKGRVHNNHQLKPSASKQPFRTICVKKIKPKMSPIEESSASSNGTTDDSDDNSTQSEPIPVPSVKRNGQVVWSVPVVNLTRFNSSWFQQKTEIKKLLKTLKKNNQTEISTTQMSGTYFITISDGMPGTYDFEIHFSENPYQICVSNSWTFSTALKKLFVNTGRSIETHFSVCNVEQEYLQELKIRALVCFSDPTYKTRTVERCSQHSDGDVLSHSHFLLSTEPTAVHENIKGQNSVIFTFVEGEKKFSADDNGAVWQVRTAYQFMCHSSCPSINNLPLKLVFTLELRGLELGRQSVELDVSTTPFLRRLEEESNVASSSTHFEPSSGSRNTNRKHNEDASSLEHPTVTSRRQCQKDDGSKETCDEVEFIIVSDGNDDSNEHGDVERNQDRSNEGRNRKRANEKSSEGPQKMRWGSRLARKKEKTPAKEYQHSWNPCYRTPLTNKSRVYIL